MTFSLSSPALKYSKSPFERNPRIVIILLLIIIIVINYKLLILYCFPSLWSCKVNDDV